MTMLAADKVLGVRPGGRCDHCLAPIALVRVRAADGAEELLPAERVGEHYELHDCAPQPWHAVPAAQKVV